MIFELRTYRIPEGKMPNILNRFETLTFDIFKRHNIEVTGFWQKNNVNEIVYICKFESVEAMTRAWNAFRGDPDWVSAKAKTEKGGPIVSEVISEVLTATPFSPLQ
ncbi:MAG: NIPSNAP family protein [bacterium]|nr:NIPSNAP family protein [bacterium]